MDDPARIVRITAETLRATSLRMRGELLRVSEYVVHLAVRGSFPGYLPRLAQPAVEENERQGHYGQYSGSDSHRVARAEPLSD